MYKDSPCLYRFPYVQWPTYQCTYVHSDNSYLHSCNDIQINVLNTCVDVICDNGDDGAQEMNNIRQNVLND